jgi:hypothetical protein
MKTHMKAIVTATVAVVLASPAVADPQPRTWRTAPVPLSTNNVYWGVGYRGYAHQHPYGHGHGYGAAAYPERRAPRQPEADCVHVTFPQCTGGG